MAVSTPRKRAAKLKIPAIVLGLGMLLLLLLQAAKRDVTLVRKDIIRFSII